MPLTVVIREDYIVFETAGHREENRPTDRRTQQVRTFIESVRGARIAIIKSSAGIHEKVLEFEKREPSHEIVETNT